jgi:aromatic-L-amino-acid/L-tryptophan decarboxylase
LPGATAAEENDRNRAFLERINASRRVFLSSTMINERFTLRIAVLSHRTHRDRVDEAVDIIAAAART